MKKTLKLLLCLTMVCALSACFLTACSAKATAIEAVSPKTEYFVGEAIDYDNLTAKITYDDGTQKQGTLKQLNLSVKSKADLSKAGETSYTVGFGALSYTVNLTVSEKDEKPSVTATAIEVVGATTEYFVGDTVDYDALTVKVTYSDNTSKEDTLKNLGATVTKKADLSKAGETSFVVTLGELQDEVTVTVNELLPYVMAVYTPAFYTNYQTASADRATGATETRADFRKTGVAYEVGNVNKFIFRPSVKAEDAQGQTVTINNAKTTVKVYEKNEGKFVLIPDTDLEGIVAIDDNTYKFTDEAAGKTFKLEISLDENEYDLDGLDDKADATLSIEFVVVGGGYNVYDQLGLSVMNDLSSQYWAKDIWKCDIDANYNLTPRSDSLKLEADDKYLCEYVGKIDWVVLHSSFALDADQMPSYYFWSEQSEGFDTAMLALSAHKDAQDLLVGSLRDGIGNGIHFTVTNVRSDTDRYSSQLDYSLNMQKGLFSTYNVSVSGNYNNITVPKTDSKGGRRLYSYLDYEDKKQRDNPVPHWAVFQMYQSTVEGKQKSFTLKNMGLTGNGGLVTETSFAPGSFMMLNCYGTVNVSNVVANAFYGHVTCDGYSDNNAVNVDSIKFYDAFSQMFYLWRANVKVVNSELIGSGGPLFILCDGLNESLDAGGSFLTVDKKSVLEAYATGSESWYKLYNAQALVQQIKSTMELGAFNNIGKTVRFHKDQNGKYTAHVKGATGEEYVNVIAAMICDPGDLMSGLNSGKLIVRGTYTTVDENDTVLEQFDTRNMYVQTLSYAVGNNGKLFAPIFQTGSLFTYTDGAALYTLGADGQQAFNFTTDFASWYSDTHDKLGIYMSAGTQSGSENAPYFGVVVGSARYDNM